MNAPIQPQELYKLSDKQIFLDDSLDNKASEKPTLIKLKDLNRTHSTTLTAKSLNQIHSPSHSDVRSKESTCISELSLSSPSLDDGISCNQVMDHEDPDDYLFFSFKGSHEIENQDRIYPQTAWRDDASQKNPSNKTNLDSFGSVFHNGIIKLDTDESNLKISIQSNTSNYISKTKNKSESSKLTSEDEQILLRLVVQLKNSWKKITKRFNNLRKKTVTLHTLRTRYNELAPKLLKKKGKFTHQEDLLLARYYSEYGSDWPKIASHVKNRTPNMLKNRYYSYIRKKRLLSDLLEELQVKDQEPIQPPEDPLPPISCVKKSEQEVEIIHLFVEQQETITYRTVEFSGINAIHFDMNAVFPEDELHVKVTPVIDPLNIDFISYNEPLGQNPYQGKNFISDIAIFDRIDDSVLFDKDSFQTLLNISDEKEDDISAEVNSKVHTYHLRERKIKMADYLYKRNEYW